MVSKRLNPLISVLFQHIRKRRKFSMTRMSNLLLTRCQKTTFFFFHSENLFCFKWIGVGYPYQANKKHHSWSWRVIIKVELMVCGLHFINPVVRLNKLTPWKCKQIKKNQKNLSFLDSSSSKHNCKNELKKIGRKKLKLNHFYKIQNNELLSSLN